jgi:NADH dehydrogenase (ubiquinone) Fe-S protein 7
MTTLTTFRAAGPAAFISSSSKKPAEATPTRALGPANVKGNPGAPPPMKKTMGTDVPLPSQEGNNSVVEYAL